MAKRRKRRSQKSFDARLMKDIRRKRIEFLREISEMVSNAVGFRGRFVPAKGEVVMMKPSKPKRGKVDRRTAHVAGWQEEPEDRHLAPEDVTNLTVDEVGI